MPKQQTSTDPYAPPPMHHDRSGGVVRVALLAVLLGAAGLGYAWFAGQPTTPLVSPAEEQQLADAGYDVTPPAVPAAPETAAPTPASEPEPTATPAPMTTPVPAAPTPRPPIDEQGE